LIIHLLLSRAIHFYSLKFNSNAFLSENGKDKVVLVSTTPWRLMGFIRVFRAQADWALTHASHRDTEQSTIEACMTLYGVTLTHWSGDHRMNNLQFMKCYCLPIRCFGRLISLHNLIHLPWILDLDTSWGWIVNFMYKPLYLRYLLDKRLGETQSRSGIREKPWAYQDLNSDPSSVQPGDSSYSDSFTPAPCLPCYISFSYMAKLLQ
jgi:hypothetical protein